MMNNDKAEVSPQINKADLDTVQGGLLPTVQKVREAAAADELSQTGTSTRPTTRVPTFKCPSDPR